MKKITALAVAAIFITSTAFAEDGKLVPVPVPVMPPVVTVDQLQIELQFKNLQAQLAIDEAMIAQLKLQLAQAQKAALPEKK